jgi:hypothetical protein
MDAFINRDDERPVFATSSENVVSLDHRLSDPGVRHPLLSRGFSVPRRLRDREICLAQELQKEPRLRRLLTQADLAALSRRNPRITSSYEAAAALS